MLWLALKSGHVRGQRADQSTDVATALVKEEHRTAADCKAKLELQLAQTKALQAQFTQTRSDLADVIARESLSLGLTTETFTATGARMLDPAAFPIADVLLRLHSQSQGQHDSNTLLIEHCARVLLHARKSVETAIRDTLKNDKEREVCPL